MFSKYIWVLLICLSGLTSAGCGTSEGFAGGAFKYNYFVYAVNSASNTVSAYKMDSDTQALVELDSAATGTNPQALGTDPEGRFLFVANNTDNSVTVFGIEPDQGTLTLLSTVAVGAAPKAFAAHPNGKFLYTSNSLDPSISVHSISSNGALRLVENHTATGNLSTSLAMSEDGKFLFASNYSSANISIYGVNASTGALNDLGTQVVTGATPFPAGIVLSRSGDLLFVADYGDSSVQTFRVDRTTGALSAGATYSAAGGIINVTTSTLNDTVYVIHTDSDEISALSFSTSGAMSLLGTLATGDAPLGVSFDPLGEFVVTANSGSTNNLSLFQVQASGALSESRGKGAQEAPVAVLVAKVKAPR